MYSVNSSFEHAVHTAVATVVLLQLLLAALHAVRVLLQYACMPVAHSSCWQCRSLRLDW
jgi:hypothetical protein